MPILNTIARGADAGGFSWREAARFISAVMNARKAGQMPKTIELDDKQKDEVETLAAVLSSEQIADYLGIGRTTFYAIMERDEEVAERYKRGRAKAVNMIANSLIKKALDGDNTSAIFYLKTQAGWKETSKTEVTGADGSALQVVIQKGLGDE